MEKTNTEQSAKADELIDLGQLLGQSHAFATIAGRCSASQAAALCRLRERQLYKRIGLTWEEFCHAHLHMSRAEADKLIRLWEEFGAAYFQLSQLTRISAETYRALLPSIRDGALLLNEELLELRPENARKVAAAIADFRRALPANPE